MHDGRQKGIGDAPVYVTFDIDCLNPSAAPLPGKGAAFFIPRSTRFRSRPEPVATTGPAS
ncbi:hypothetical protein CXB49_22245 [Chromobacterium sp. ATCC 53434]|nr:hypothetical protein CXB49_22245 [Chromobacterium sp. ATCC 53434]